MRLLILLSGLLLYSSNVAAQAFAPDLGFGQSGKIVVDSGICEKVLPLADGSILVLGGSNKGRPNSYVVATKFTASGAVDNAFGTQGSFLITPRDFKTTIQFMAEQPDGKLVLGGIIDTGYGILGFGVSCFYVIRLKTNGTYDSTFGQAGRVIYHASYYFAKNTDEPSGVAIQPDGKIVVAGVSNPINSTDDVTLVRFLPDGRVDSTFGTYGMARTHMGQSNVRTNDLMVLPDGRLIIAAWGFVDSVGYCWVALRYGSNGNLDSTFGTNGVAAVNYGPFAICRAMAMRADGKIILAGNSDSLIVACLDTTGKLDTGFGAGSGAVSVAPSTYIFGITCVNNTVVSAYTEPGDSTWAVYRLAGDGSTIGNGALLRAKILSNANRAFCIAGQPNNKILIGGSSTSEPGIYARGKFVLARYHLGSLGTPVPETPPASLVVFPNPAHGAVHIRSGNAIARVHLYSLAGALLGECVSLGDAWRLPADVPAGNYVLRIQFSNPSVSASFYLLTLQTP